MRRAWPWLRSLGALAILVALGLRLGAEAFLDGLRAVDGWAVGAAVAIGAVTTACSAARWRLIARRLGLPLPFGAALADYYRGLLLNAVLPAGVLGDVHRAVGHGRRAGDVGRGVRAVVFERCAGQVVLVAAGIAVWCAGAVPVDLPAVGVPVPTLPVPGLAVAALVVSALVVAALPVAALVVAVLPVAALVVAVLPVPVLPVPVLPVPVLPVAALVVPALVVAALVVPAVVGARSAKVRRALRTAWADARVGVVNRAALPEVLLLSVVALAGHVALFVVAARTAGVQAPVAVLGSLAVLGLLVMAIPLNVAGFGPREAFLAVAFGAAGLGAAQGLATGVVYGVLALVGSLPGVFTLVRSQHRQVLPERLDERREDVAALVG